MIIFFVRFKDFSISNYWRGEYMGRLFLCWLLACFLGFIVSYLIIRWVSGEGHLFSNIILVLSWFIDGADLQNDIWNY